MEDLPKSVRGAARLKEIRRTQNITQTEMAKLMGIKQGTYAKYENGQLSLSEANLKLLAAHLKVSVPYLLGFEQSEGNLPAFLRWEDYADLKDSQLKEALLAQPMADTTRQKLLLLQDDLSGEAAISVLNFEKSLQLIALPEKKIQKMITHFITDELEPSKAIKAIRLLEFLDSEL